MWLASICGMDTMVTASCIDFWMNEKVLFEDSARELFIPPHFFAASELCGPGPADEGSSVVASVTSRVSLAE